MYKRLQLATHLTYYSIKPNTCQNDTAWHHENYIPHYSTCAPSHKPFNSACTHEYKITELPNVAHWGSLGSTDNVGWCGDVNSSVEAWITAEVNQHGLADCLSGALRLGRRRKGFRNAKRKEKGNLTRCNNDTMEVQLCKHRKKVSNVADESLQWCTVTCKNMKDLIEKNT